MLLTMQATLLRSLPEPREPSQVLLHGRGRKQAMVMEKLSGNVLPRDSGGEEATVVVRAATIENVTIGEAACLETRGLTYLRRSRTS